MRGVGGEGGTGISMQKTLKSNIFFPKGAKVSMEFLSKAQPYLSYKYKKTTYNSCGSIKCSLKSKQSLGKRIVETS